MGLRFQKRIKLAPGIKLNLTHRGVSASVGKQGANVTVGRGRVRGTVGAPGTGLSYSAEKRYRGSAAVPSTAVPRWVVLAAVAGVLLLVAWLVG